MTGSYQWTAYACSGHISTLCTHLGSTSPCFAWRATHWEPGAPGPNRSAANKSGVCSASANNDCEDGYTSDAE